jgi:hypothetical protein
MALPSSVRHYVGTLPVHKFDFLTELRSSLIALQYMLLHCIFEINIVIETRKNGQPTRILINFQAHQSLEILFSRSKSQNSTSNIFSLQQPQKWLGQAF